ncbi:MAG: DUF503 domain-containing protein [Myxococcota bacterium]
MFACVARVTLEIPDTGSLKAKRQVLRRVTDRVKARFNVSVAEVDDNGLWQRATVGLAVVGNERRFVNEQMDKILQFIDDMYVAPMVSREMEIVSFGDLLYGEEDALSSIHHGQRSLAEAEGLGEWEKRHEAKSAPSEPLRPKETKNGKGKRPRTLPLEEARAKARALRNPREWEKE